jgi:hypothetical protein
MTVRIHAKHVRSRGARHALRIRLLDACDPRHVSTSLVLGETRIECDARDARLVLKITVAHELETRRARLENT